MSQHTTKKQDLVEEVTFAEFLQLTLEEETLVRIRLARHCKRQEAHKQVRLTKN